MASAQKRTDDQNAPRRWRRYRKGRIEKSPPLYYAAMPNDEDELSDLTLNSTRSASPPDVDKTLLIQTWQETVVAQAETRDLGVVGSLYESCVELFKVVLKAIRKKHNLSQYQGSLERSLGTLYFWGDGFGVERGELDDALELSRELRDVTLSLLISIAEVLSQGLLHHAFPDQSEQKSVLQTSNIVPHMEKARCAADEPEDTRTDSMESMEDIIKDLETFSECLTGLSSSIECPAKDVTPGADEDVRAPSELQGRAVHHFYADLISSRFPKAEADLVECLAKCNWKRYMRLQAERSANAQEHCGNDSPKGADNFAFAFPASFFGKSKFHNSGLNSSLSKESTDAVSVAAYFVSTRAESSHSKLPSLSEEAKRGVPFSCPACSKTVLIWTQGAWKRHIFQDLMPYVCIFHDCPYSNMPFKNRAVWTDHLGLDHGFAPEWEAQFCQLCLEPTARGREAVSIHLARHMEEIALAALPRAVNSDANSEPRSGQVPLRIGDHEAVTELYRSRLERVMQLGCRSVAKAWVKALQPRKQTIYPYRGPGATRPSWWPTDVPHVEPDHLSKPNRVKFLLAILRLPKACVDVLEKSTNDSPDEDVRERRPLLEEIYRVARAEACLRAGELDPDTILYVAPSPDSLVPHLSKQKSRPASGGKKPRRRPAHDERRESFRSHLRSKLTSDSLSSAKVT